DAVAEMSDRERARGISRVEQLGDAEVEQFRDAVFRDENVGRLQVAVHDEVLMRVVHGRADLLKQSNALFHAQPASIAVDIDGFAVDVFEDEVRRSVGSASAVEQTS